jgi:hypothetical protein
MAKTKEVTRRNQGANVWATGRGYNGVKRTGSCFSWEYVGPTLGRVTKGGYDTAEEAAYAYDEFLTTHVPNADTNQALGYLKDRVVLAIREKISKAEKHKPQKNTRPVGKYGFRGVSANPKSKINPFMSYIQVHKKQIYVGSFPTAEDAARAHDIKAIQLLGVDAITNASLGLLPPDEEIKFTPGRSSPQLNVINTNASHPAIKIENNPTPPAKSNAAPMLQPLTPEQERLAQIEAARLMSDTADEEEETAPKLLKTAEPIQPDPDLPLPPVINPARADITQPAAVNLSPISELMPLTKPFSAGDELRKRAELLLKQAAEADELAVRHSMIAVIETMSESLAGFQQALIKQIDYGAELEKQISELKAMVNK